MTEQIRVPLDVLKAVVKQIEGEGRIIHDVDFALVGYGLVAAIWDTPTRRRTRIYNHRGEQVHEY